MNDIPYNFRRNLHTLEGAHKGLTQFLSGRSVSSLLDVGAGIGTWLRAAQDLGIADIAGIDGIAADPSQLHVAPGIIKVFDLTEPVWLGRRFDAALCLEVAEHLKESAAATLVETLCMHSDLIFFSAAAPGQHGEHHINCRWPTYWQELFNACGYACRDDVRQRIWDIGSIEPWYRQNSFTAYRLPQPCCRRQGAAHRASHPSRYDAPHGFSGFASVAESSRFGWRQISPPPLRPAIRALRAALSSQLRAPRLRACHVRDDHALRASLESSLIGAAFPENVVNRSHPFSTTRNG